MTVSSEYALELLREGANFTLYRGWQHGNPSPVLAVALAADMPSPQSLGRLEHEYSLAAELDSAWAAKPLALTRHEGRTVLILHDPGGEPLDRLLQREQGQPLDLTRFLRVAINLAKVLGQVHRQGLIHKDIKPANVLVDDAGNVWLTGFGITSQLPHSHQEPVSPEIIAGTLAYMAGDYAEALSAADKVKPLLSAATVNIPLLDYFYYAALTVAACYENASADQQQGWRKLLTAHREQLREWAENYPPTFADKHTLVLAETARIEGRALDAMDLYEQAIQSARENGFVQNEAVAYEVAARFYLARGFETIAHTYLRNARNCYDRWGALGKVKQLDDYYPHLHEERDSTSPTATIGTPVGRLDVETVVKASQALSSEIVLSRLIEKLMRIAVEHAGAERGLLILLRGDELRIEAEATTGHGKVEVSVGQAAITPSDLPNPRFIT
jgi:serine/threonine protein kinase